MPRLIPVTYRGKLVAAFVALVSIVALVYSFSFVALIDSAESRLMGSTLEGSLRMVIDHDIKRGKPPRLDYKSRLYSDGDPTRPIPARFANVPLGYSEYTEGEDLHVYKAVVDGTTYVLTRFQGDFEHWERSIALSGILVFAALLAASLVIGILFARGMLRPVEKLLAQTGRMEQDLKSGRIYSEDALAGPWADDELGTLGRQFQTLSRRLRDLLLREKQFASEVSHELRTPLTVISMSIELLEDGDNLTDRQKKILNRARNTTSRMRDLIMVFLSMFRSDINAGTDPLTLAETAEGFLQSWKEAAGSKGLAFEIIDKCDPDKKFNTILAGTVLNNLVTNSIRYTEKGSVRVALSPEAITISDTGSGISEADRERIFDEGYRGRQARGTAGFGIGLSIAKRCCDSLGWKLDLQTEENKGTTFTIRLN